MKPNGTDATRITFTKNKNEVMPEWSPNGKWLVFIALARSRRFDSRR